MSQSTLDFRPLSVTERQRLSAALRDNAETESAIFINQKDTSFAGGGIMDEVSDAEVIAVIKSVPCHY